MRQQLIILPEARTDLSDSRDWYEACRAGLGSQFLDRVAECTDLIQQNPEFFERVVGDFRRAIVRRFPYAVFYRCSSREVVIHGVFHIARDASKWRHRLV